MTSTRFPRGARGRAARRGVAAAALAALLFATGAADGARAQTLGEWLNDLPDLSENLPEAPSADDMRRAFDNARDWVRQRSSELRDRLAEDDASAAPPIVAPHDADVFLALIQFLDPEARFASDPGQIVAQADGRGFAFHLPICDDAECGQARFDAVIAPEDVPGADWANADAGALNAWNARVGAMSRAYARADGAWVLEAPAIVSEGVSPEAFLVALELWRAELALFAGGSWATP